MEGYVCCCSSEEKPYGSADQEVHPEVFPAAIPSVALITDAVSPWRKVTTTLNSEYNVPQPVPGPSGMVHLAAASTLGNINNQEEDSGDPTWMKEMKTQFVEVINCMHQVSSIMPPAGFSYCISSLMRKKTSGNNNGVSSIMCIPHLLFWKIIFIEVDSKFPIELG